MIYMYAIFRDADKSYVSMTGFILGHLILLCRMTHLFVASLSWLGSPSRSFYSVLYRPLRRHNCFIRLTLKGAYVIRC